jgi:ATP adenylyltransferase
MKPDGFNIGINLGKVAGAGVPGHLHIHVVPRWTGDTNFMPVLAGTTVLPEALRDIAAKLRATLAL